MNKLILIVALALISTGAWGRDLSRDLSRLVGYTIVEEKTIDGWFDDDDKGDSFEGCDYDRVIVFTDNTGLACSSYSYSYAYRPTAILLVKNGSIKMIVDDEVYDMRQVR